MRSTSLAILATGVALASGPGWLTQRASADTIVITARGDDARVANITHRIATAGLARCLRSLPVTGMVLQHLTQFQLADRPGMIAAYGLDRGPGIVAVVPGGPAERAGVQAGDVIVALGGVPVPAETGVALPFNQTRARAHADEVLTILERLSDPFEMSLLREGQPVTVRVAPVPACPSRVHLARSDQRNAFADGKHVFLTTRLLADTTNDHELAFVIAHEMAHNVADHATVMRMGGVKRGLGRTLGRSGRTVRRAEREADALAGELLLDAGYDPVAGAAVLRRLGDSDLGITLFAAHDSIGNRIEALRAIAAARNAQ